MQSRRKLRFRLVLSFALFGFGLSALFAVASLYVRAKVEDQLVVSALQHDVDQAVDQIIAHPDQQSHSELLEAWFKSDRTLYKMPLAWQNLASGVHNITETDANGVVRHYKLAVRRKDGIIGFVRYDVGREELGKRQLVTALVTVVLLFSLLSLAIGLWLSRKVLKPVTLLANRLRDFRKAGKAEPLAQHFADDEVGELAHALDEYAARLTAMVERDREFNSDVSHEL
ncbi:MAG TPA: sensor histidine kinase, partial [Rhodanobacter sp.]